MDPSTALRLGPYELHAEIGRGGMGVVWRGRHRARGVPVAIKVLRSGDEAHDPGFIADFRQEARAAGRLNHPAIISVLDYGLLSPSLEQASNNALVAGQPFIVMEWLAGSALDQPAAAPGSFDELSRLLLTLLDALAHAHARGVLHRDIKPANVMLTPEGRARLIDFGIARLDTPDPRDDGLAGTISYMAPEQILEGLRRDQGPWTDLYAIGCLAYRLSAGRLVFERDSMVSMMHAHLEDPAPPLIAYFPVPDRFEAWVHCLLEKSPRARFSCAADAACALRELSVAPPATTPVAAAPWASPTAAPWEVDSPALMNTLGAVIDRRPGATIPAPAPNGLEVTGWPRPPLPLTWRREERAAAGLAGIGIFGMRTIPMVGRESERDAIWQAMHQAVADDGVRVVVLRGAAGCGKSRIAQWMMERAEELGCARGLTAWHGPTASEIGGAVGMLARHLGCTGLDWAALQARVAHRLSPLGASPAQVQALAEVLRGVARENVTAPQGGFTSDAQRTAVLADALATLADERALFLWLDDVQWGPEALRLVERLLRQRQRAMLVVLTVREGALGERPDEGAALAALEDDARVRFMPVDGLASASCGQLVEAMIGLEPTLADRVVRRSGGNPLFAVQLVGDLVDRGMLEAGADGRYALSAEAKGASFALADDLHELWRRRAEQLLAHLGATEDPSVRDALEIAAVLGQEVRVAGWRAVCAEADVAWSPPLLQALLATGWVIDVAEGFRFAHGLLRESLETGARERGALPRHHAACARTLAAAGPSDPEHLVRIAEHALGASDLRGAMSAFFEATYEALRRGQKGRVRRYAARLTRLFEDHESLRDDRGRSELLYVRAEAERDLHPERALPMLEDAERRAREGGHELLLARVLRALYQHHHRRVAATRVAPLIDEAVALFEKHGAFAEAVGCLHITSRDALERHAVEEARVMLASMQRLAQLSAEPVCQAECLDRSSDLLRHDGETARALQASEEAIRGLERSGCLARAANALNAKAEIQWLNAHDLEGASTTLRDAIARQEALGSHALTYFPRYNLASIEILRGELASARKGVAWLAANTESLGNHVVRHLVHLMQAIVAAHDADWHAWDRHLAAALAGDLDESLVEEDLLLWKHAAQVVRGAGQGARAGPAEHQAQEIERRMKRA